MAKSKAAKSTRRSGRSEVRTEKSASKRIAISHAPEDLDAPLDGDIRVERYARRHKVILDVGGRAVSSANIGEIRENFGGTWLRVAAVAGVHTLTEHRMKGCSRRVMENSARWMRQEGYDLALLFGIGSFYPKFGYAPVLPNVRFTLAVAEASKFRSTGYRFVGFKDEHLRAILKMYHKNNATRTGPIRRDPRTWRPFRRGIRWGIKPVCRVALNRRSQTVGYFVYDKRDEGARIIEVGLAGPEVFPVILAACARLAARRGSDEIRFLLPEDSALMGFCTPLGLERQVRYRPDGGAMARMINIPSTMDKLAPMLGGRMTTRGKMTIRTNLEDVSLVWSNGRMSVSKPRCRAPQVYLPQWALVQMLYGYQDASSFAARKVLKGSARSVGVLDQMFPTGPHYYYKVDSF